MTILATAIFILIFFYSLPLAMIFICQDPTQVSLFVKMYIGFLGRVNQFPLYF